MEPSRGREADAVAFLAALARVPYRFDFYQAMRRLECLYDGNPRWGRAVRPVEEPVRLGQDPDLSFAPAPLASFTAVPAKLPRLQVRFFGLFGPNGPLPIHLTEHARERQQHAGDATFNRFLDVFHHRSLALFYRAWADAQPHVSRDRPDEDRFASHVGAFVGMAPDEFRRRDSVPDLGRFFHVGVLARHVRNAEGLGQVLRHFFKLPVEIEERVGHWMRLSGRDLSRAGRENCTLGAGAVLGSSVWDRQHKFRIHLGPLTLAQYESFLAFPPVSPKPRSGEGGSKPLSGEGGSLRQLVDWVRTYLSFELDWDVRLVLKRNEVPRAMLGRGPRLGWTSWLGERRASSDAADLCLDAERLAGAQGEVAA